MELRSLLAHLRRRIEWPQVTLAGLIVVMLAIGSASADRFATWENLANVVEQSTTLGLVTLGQMLVVLTGGIDLSVGAVMSLGSILLAGSVDGSEARLWPIVCSVLALGALVGLVNGLIIVRLKVNPLIMTLGMASILYGAALLYRRQPGGSVPVFFTELSYANLGGLPLSGLLLLLIYALAFVFLNYTRLGRRLYAVGSDLHAAHLSGIAISRVLCFTYATSGFLAALAGVYLTSRSGVGDPRAGVGFDLASITPVVIGGTLLRGEKAIGRSANREAWSHVEQAIMVLSHLPRNKATLEQAVDLRLAVRTCLSPLGEFARAVELGREAVPLAKALDDPRREALVHGAVSISSSHMGRHADATEHSERAVAIAESLHEPTLRIAVRHAFALPPMFRGAFRTAIGCFQRDVGIDPEQIPERLVAPWGVGLFQEAFTRVSYCLSQNNAALCFSELGEFDQALLHSEQAVEFAQTLDLLYLRAITDAHLGAVHLRKGDTQRALQLAQRWLQAYATADLPVPQLTMAWRLGEVFNVSGHVEDAVALFERAWQFAESKSVLAFAPRVLALLGDAYGRAGRTDEAAATGQRALHLARQLGQRGDEAWALYLLGNVHGYGVDANQVRDSYQQALVLAHELGMRPLQGQCHFALGELAKKAGERRHAQEQFNTAVSMFRAMGMKFWQEKAEAALVLDAQTAAVNRTPARAARRKPISTAGGRPD